MTLLTKEYAVRVWGSPAPKGSLKCIGARGKQRHVLIEDNTNTKPWRQLIEKAGRALPVTMLEGPVGLEVTLTLARPKSHYGTGRNATVLKASSPLWPISHQAGDTDKLERTVLDGLQDAGLFVDDCLVVELVGRKVYVDTPGAPDRLDRPGALIRLYPILRPTACTCPTDADVTADMRSETGQHLSGCPSTKESS